MHPITDGPALRRAREKAGLTQAGLARAMGLSVSGLWRIEHGERPLTEAMGKLAGYVLAETAPKKPGKSS